MSTFQSQIVSDPKIHGGEPVIDGTSTPVRAIAELWNQGMPAEEFPCICHTSSCHKSSRLYDTAS
jgi:uncharacterized protein (DUF433 family)